MKEFKIVPKSLLLHTFLSYLCLNFYFQEQEPI